MFDIGTALQSMICIQMNEEEMGARSSDVCDLIGIIVSALQVSQEFTI